LETVSHEFQRAGKKPRGFVINVQTKVETNCTR